MRMREGICKLLAVSTQKDQLLRAVKSLMVCNARIRAYRAQLQSQKGEPDPCRTAEQSSENGTKDRVACRAKVAISDIRIPLMWKGSDHFSNKEKSQRYAVFCLFRMGAEVFDTEVTIVDKAITDICFENVTIFDEARPDFQVKVEVYSCCTEESLYITNTPKKLAKKLKTSLSKATGRKLKATLEEDSTESLLPADPVIHGAKYSLLAYTTLGLESTEDNFRTHNLTITGNEESSFWLPLYGNMCCRLVAQPSCMTRDMMAGFLNQQQTVGDLTSWRRLYCVLRGGKLFCYYSPEEIEAKLEPALTVSINKETRIRAVDKDSRRRTNNFSVINPVSGEAVMQRFATDSRDELHKWMEAFWQHFYDLSQWKHCCEELMKIEIMSPRKPPLFLTKEATSVYHDMSIDSPVKLEGLADIIQRKIEESDGEFLLGQRKESASALWASLFDGSHEMTVQKSLPLDPKGDTTSPNDSRGKKRRAPPPPSDKSPYSAKAQVNTEQLGKENWGKLDHKSASSSSLESALATKMQQLQTPVAAPRKIGPCRKSSLAGQGNPISLVSKTRSETKPVPTPRQKGITELLDPRSWLQP
ncbi:rhotekin-2 isoform X1 [Myiozetetes cayanensis]|uniref:rhotekin-2 isoform X1 n=1 Tax=Myiozetetes cayanensis TaxID=478635 RepID=UPI00215DFB16|nr:rhotekin-2 isoform X1 [Myiozetetes cayanensis]XP_050196721.1 rhotekin-2 isoform X1 [Myiozetetes cayanensis]XP_050196726.1 rhotekin-2 isoform X1 [Myiozetetes cayanensis]XP_050196727.1 rhotekin-2 isoform X1 [Myiozetetes cayanensis]XP_050196728.1 rhotekin-2 isoform X1 [Myiozetetes cayanensis]XP_050196729.1 rhotekin-2 isoform X1 [Myiozetetes cayanensis]